MDADQEVYTLNDRRVLARTLESSSIEAAYLLADLEDPYFRDTRWYKCGRALVMIYEGLRTPALLTFGDGPGAARILREKAGDLPFSCRGMLWPGHERIMKNIYKTITSRRMNRMGLKQCDFQPRQDSHVALPLVRDDLPDLIELMTHYPGNYFESAMFREGLYFGIRLEGRLVTAGGVHTISPAHGVAAVGNIVTHADYRRKGLAAACTSALLASLFRKVGGVALNVEEKNEAAIRCYEGLGFSKCLTYLEGDFEKRI